MRGAESTEGSVYMDAAVYSFTIMARTCLPFCLQPLFLSLCLYLEVSDTHYVSALALSLAFTV